MIETSKNISKITVNVSELNYLVKRQRLIVCLFPLNIYFTRDTIKYTHMARSKVKRKKNCTDKF